MRTGEFKGKLAGLRGRGVDVDSKRGASMR